MLPLVALREYHPSFFEAAEDKDRRQCITVGTITHQLVNSQKSCQLL